MKIEKTESGQIIIDGDFECFVYPKKSPHWIDFVGFDGNEPTVTGFKIFMENEISAQTKVDKFKSELKKLLAHYDANIEWNAWGDLDGVHDEKMDIYIGADLAISIEGCNVSAECIE